MLSRGVLSEAGQSLVQSVGVYVNDSYPGSTLHKL